MARAGKVAFGVAGMTVVVACLGLAFGLQAVIGGGGGFLLRDFSKDVVGRPNLHRAGNKGLLDSQRLLRQLPRLGQPAGEISQEDGEVVECFRTSVSEVMLLHRTDRFPIPRLRCCRPAGTRTHGGQVVPSLGSACQVALLFLNVHRFPVVAFGLIPPLHFLKDHTELMPHHCFRCRFPKLLKERKCGAVAMFRFVQLTFRQRQHTDLVENDALLPKIA